MRAYLSGAALVVVGLVNMFVTDVGAETAVQGMQDNDFIQVVLATFQFHAGVNLLVLAAYGFLASRAWPSTGAVEMRKVLAVLPGLFLIAIAIGLTGWQYTEIGQAVSSKSVVNYAASWSLWSYLIQALQALAALLIVLPLRS